MITRDEALTALDEVRRYHDTDTRWTDRLDKVRAYIDTLESALPPDVAATVRALVAPLNDDAEEYAFPDSAPLATEEPAITDEDTAEIQTIGDSGKTRGRRK